jgi:hypothetical protein
MKSCFRCLLDGNQWLNQWRGGLGQGTGGYNTPILFSGRAYYDDLGGYYGFSDLTITNNLITDSPGGINVGDQPLSQSDLYPIRNVLIGNNLMYGINWGEMDSTSGGVGQYGAPIFLVLGGPFENLRVENNTMWDNRRWNSSYSPWNAGISFLGPSRGAYFRFQDNFLAHNPDGAYDVLVWPSWTAEEKPAGVLSGSGTIAAKFLHDVDWSGNIAVPGVTDSRLEANYSNPADSYSPATCASYWGGISGITCHGTSETTAYARFASVGLTDYANGNFRLTSGSPYYAAQTGVNQDALDAAIGKVKSVSVTDASTSGATINYMAPDAAACTVEYGTM